MFREAVLGLLGVDKAKGVQPAKKAQALGEYCAGKDLKACRDSFGDALHIVCSTCPD